jgi:hypothetical protein
MANTFIKIASVTVGAGEAANIDFTSIPSTYTDLMIVHSMRGANASTIATVDITFNNSTSGYSNRSIFGTSTTVYAYTYTSLQYLWGGYYQGNSTTANTFGNGQIYIPNYANATLAKTILIDQVSENNLATSDAAFVTLNGGLWNNTDAITSVKLKNEYGNWKQYSTATLYGIKKD